MRLVHESHQLHFFSNNADIEATSLFISAMTEKLKEHFTIIPITGREFDPSTGQQRDFLVLRSPDNRIRIEFPVNEIVIFSEGGSQVEFKELSINVLKSLSSLFPMKLANRLSVLNSKFYLGTSTQYDDLYRELFTYKAVRPFEWDNRIAERQILPVTGEEINSISAIRRLEVQSPFIEGGQFKDTIVTDIDSNTIFQNTEKRFSLLESQRVFDGLFDNSEEVTVSLNRYFD